MNFLAPFMLIGAIGIGVPIAIHFIGRRRARVVPFAALEFLMATRRKTARRWGLREHILLAIRALACLAIAVALAKPFTACEQQGPEVTRGPQAAVIIVDDSFAAGYFVDGKPWIRRAGDEARRIIMQLGPEAEVAIVRASEGTEQPTELTRNHLRLRDQLLSLEPTARPADTTRALARAAPLLAASSSSRKTVFLLSLLAATGMRAAESPWHGEGPILVVRDLRPHQMPNIAVTQLRVDSEGGAGSRGVAFDAEVENFGDNAATVDILLSIADRVVARGQLEIEAHGRKAKRFLAALPPNTRATDASVSLTGSDGLAIDDVRFARAMLRDELRVLLVNGDPRTVRYDDELFYLEAALRPGDRGDSGTQVRAITADEFAAITRRPEASPAQPGVPDPTPHSLRGSAARPGTAGAIDLNDFDVVVLANVPALPSGTVSTLHDWVSNGGGVLIAAGDRVDAAAYDKTMLPLLPQSLRDPIDTTWGASEADRDSRALHLVKWEPHHPIFAPFETNAPELADAKFFKVALLGPATPGKFQGNASLPPPAGLLRPKGSGWLDNKVLARFTNGGTALVEASIGAGRTLLFTSTLDRDWNDFPIHAGYLPFVQQAVRHLARKHGPSKSGDHLVGSSVVIPTEDVTKLEVRGPNGSSTVFEGDRLANRRSVRFTRTDRPGIYRVIGTDPTGMTRNRDELSFVVNVDPRGSNLTEANATALPTSGTGGGTLAPSSQRRVELWHALAAIVLLLLVAEGILVQR